METPSYRVPFSQQSKFRNSLQAFDRVIALDTTAHLKAKMRLRATRVGGKLTWRPSPTAEGETIDALLLRNVRVSRCAPRELLSGHTEVAGFSAR